MYEQFHQVSPTRLAANMDEAEAAGALRILERGLLRAVGDLTDNVHPDDLADHIKTLNEFEQLTQSLVAYLNPFKGMNLDQVRSLRNKASFTTPLEDLKIIKEYILTHVPGSEALFPKKAAPAAAGGGSGHPRGGRRRVTRRGSRSRLSRSRTRSRTRSRSSRRSRSRTRR